MMKNQVTLGIVGCGRIADGAHFPALTKIDGVRIKYACDLILKKAEAQKEKYGDKIENAITDYKIILNDPEVDAVYVLTPNYAHYDITMAALSAGKHVFCEKPITVNYELSKEMADKAKAVGKMLMIGVCNRYNKSVQLLKKMNEDGEFGNIYHIYCSFRSYRNIPGLGGAFTTKAQSGGGVLIDWGVHFLDLILFILGGAKIKTVTANAYNEMAKDMKEYVYKSMWAEDTADVKNGINDVDDFISGYIRTDKANISFNGAWAQNINKEEMFVDFLGDKGGARLTYGSTFTFYTTKNGVLETISPEYEIPPQHAEEDKAFVSAIKNGGEKLVSDIDEVLESAKLLDLLYKSAEKGEEIRI